MGKILESSEIINHEFKGFPSSENPMTLSDIALQEWSLLKGDLPMPVATLNAKTIENNSRWMRSFTEKYGVHISPHGKTSMSPQLFQKQIDDGAWAITVANVHQLRLCRKWGIKRVFMANQVAGVNNLRALTKELALDPELDFYMLIDSIENTKQLAVASKEQNLQNPIQVLVELGFPGGRTGCRSLKSAMEVARNISSYDSQIVLRGVEGYEALLRNQPNPEKKIKEFLFELKKLLHLCINEDLFNKKPAIISAGGSDFFDLVIQELSDLSKIKEVFCLIRSGCYLTHDSINYKKIFEKMRKRSPELDKLESSLQPALQVWGVVQSLPESGLCIVNIGKRDISYDLDMPIPELIFSPSKDKSPKGIDKRCRVKGLNDQHTYLETTKFQKINVGDYIAFGISHPCTTFDKWRLIYLVDNIYNVIGGIRTYLS